MGIGNLKDNGNKGNNFPYQLAMLQILEQILVASGGGGVVRTPTLTRVTVAGVGTVAAGAGSVTFYNAGLANATVAGTTLASGEQVTFAVQGHADTLAAITYNALTSTLVIAKVV